ncbi:MAG: hypothetical protein RL885_07555 [Planctomycetota bacterium]
MTELNPSGTAIVYSTFLGGDQDEVGLDIAVDRDQLPSDPTQVVVTGWTRNDLVPPGFPVFPSTTGVVQPAAQGDTDGFVSRLSLDPSNTTVDLLTSTYLGGSENDHCNGLALYEGDSGIEVVVVGGTLSSNFPAGNSLLGTSDAFVSRLDPGFTTLQASTYLGGTDDDDGTEVVVHVNDDGNLEFTLTGITTSNDFPTSPGAFDTSYNSYQDAFVTRLSQNLGSVVYSTYLGGSGDDGGWELTLVPGVAKWPVNVTGYTASTNFPIQNAYDTTHNGGLDVFVLRLNTSGTTVMGSTYVGGDQNDRPFGLAADSALDVVVAGRAGSSGFPTTTGAYQITYGGGTADAFVLKFRLTQIGNPGQ